METATHTRTTLVNGLLNKNSNLFVILSLQEDDASKKKQNRRSILSFDGGGSKGVMEVVVLETVLQLVQSVFENPDDLPK